MAAAGNPPNNQSTQTTATTNGQTIDLTIFTGVNGGKTTGDE